MRTKGSGTRSPRSSKGKPMETVVRTITKDNFDAVCNEAGRVIREGGLVAFPTETVYGLGADAFLAEASKKIYAAKGRPSDNPLIAHIADIEDLKRVAKDVPESAGILAKTFWSGPLTMVLKRNPDLPKETTGGRDTVAVRMPSHPVAAALIKASGTAVAAPSANVSGKPSPTMARHVIGDLDGRVDMIIDDGASPIGLESTIVDLTGESPVILRPGFITKEQLEEALGKDVAHFAKEGGEITEALAPGMKYRHYAPEGTLTIVSGSRERVRDYIETALKTAAAEGLRRGVLTTGGDTDSYDAECVISLGDREDAGSQAKELYRALRLFDEKRTQVIYAEAVPEEGIGAAVMNRLKKAAGGREIRV